jgi:hypothetical protein
MRNPEFYNRNATKKEIEHNHDRFLKLLFDPNLLVTRSEPKLKYTHPKVTYKSSSKVSKYSKTQKINDK